MTDHKTITHPATAVNSAPEAGGAPSADNRPADVVFDLASRMSAVPCFLMFATDEQRERLLSAVWADATLAPLLNEEAARCEENRQHREAEAAERAARAPTEEELRKRAASERHAAVSTAFDALLDRGGREVVAVVASNPPPTVTRRCGTTRWFAACIDGHIVEIAADRAVFDRHWHEQVSRMFGSGEEFYQGVDEDVPDTVVGLADLIRNPATWALGGSDRAEQFQLVEIELPAGVDPQLICYEDLDLVPAGPSIAEVAAEFAAEVDDHRAPRQWTVAQQDAGGLTVGAEDRVDGGDLLGVVPVDRLALLDDVGAPHDDHGAGVLGHVAELRAGLLRGPPGAEEGGELAPHLLDGPDLALGEADVRVGDEVEQRDGLWLRWSSECERLHRGMIEREAGREADPEIAAQREAWASWWRSVGEAGLEAWIAARPESAHDDGPVGLFVAIDDNGFPLGRAGTEPREALLLALERTRAQLSDPAEILDAVGPYDPAKHTIDSLVGQVFVVRMTVDDAFTEPGPAVSAAESALVDFAARVERMS